MNYVFLVERSSQILWLSLIFDLNLVWGIIPGWGSGMQLGASLSPWILVLVIRNTCHVGVTDALLRLTIIQFIYLVMNGYHGMASEQSVYFVLDTRTSPIHRIKLGSSWMGFEFRPSRKWRTFLYNNRYTQSTEKHGSCEHCGALPVPANESTDSGTIDSNGCGYHIEGDNTQEECPWCLCRPCVTDISNKQLWWESECRVPNAENSKLRKNHY